MPRDNPWRVMRCDTNYFSWASFLSRSQMIETGCRGRPLRSKCHACSQSRTCSTIMWALTLLIPERLRSFKVGNIFKKKVNVTHIFSLLTEKIKSVYNRPINFCKLSLDKIPQNSKMTVDLQWCTLKSVVRFHRRKESIAKIFSLQVFFHSVVDLTFSQCRKTK